MQEAYLRVSQSATAQKAESLFWYKRMYSSIELSHSQRVTGTNTKNVAKKLLKNKNNNK